MKGLTAERMAGAQKTTADSCSVLCCYELHGSSVPAATHRLEGMASENVRCEHLHGNVERDMLEKACSGDVGAFRRLYDAHAPNVYRYGMLQTGNRQAAEDILQETMIALWRGREKLSEISSVSSWIIAIARNKTIDYIRKKAPTVSVGEFDDNWQFHGTSAEAETFV